MKTIIYFCLSKKLLCNFCSPALTGLLLTFCLGCGSDNPVTNNPSPPSDPVIDTVTLFQKDSIYFNEFNFSDSSSISYLCNLTVDTLRAEFNFHTFKVRSLAVYKIDADTVLNYSKFSTSFFDTSIALVLPINNINFINSFKISYDGGIFSGVEFGSLTNIKLWCIKRS